MKAALGQEGRGSARICARMCARTLLVSIINERVVMDFL